MASRKTLVPLPNGGQVTAEHINALYHLINGSYDAKHPTGMPVRLIAFDGKSETGIVDTLSYALTVRHRNTAVDRTAAFYGAQGTGNGQLVAEVRAGRLRATRDAVVGTATSPVLVEGSMAGGILSGTYPNPDFAYPQYHTIHRFMVMAWYGADNAVPFGWGLCNGQTMPLLAADGQPLTINGQVQYITTPDMRGRFPVGAGGVSGLAVGAVMEGSAAASTGNTRLAALAALQHNHAGTPHTHPHWHQHGHSHAHGMRNHQHAHGHSHVHGMRNHQHAHGHTHYHNMRNHQHAHGHTFTHMGTHYHQHTHVSYMANHGHNHDHYAPAHNHNGSIPAFSVTSEPQVLEGGNFIAAGNTAQHHHKHAVNIPTLTVTIQNSSTTDTTDFDAGGVTHWYSGGASGEQNTSENTTGATWTQNPAIATGQGWVSSYENNVGTTDAPTGEVTPTTWVSAWENNSSVTDGVSGEVTPTTWVSAWENNNGATDSAAGGVDVGNQNNDLTAANFGSNRTSTENLDVRPPYLAWHWIIKL